MGEIFPVKEVVVPGVFQTPCPAICNGSTELFKI